MKQRITWERHGDIHVCLSNGWKRAFIYRDGNCSTYFAIAGLGGTAQELREFCGQNLRKVKAQVVAHIREIWK